jgi:hypothetical protein
MKKFTIWVNQFDMGSFEGVDEKNALDQYARDAGYKNWKEIEDAKDVVDISEWTAEDYAMKRALEAAREQREMERKYDKDVEWTVADVVSLCRDMDGACEECPLYDAEAGRCFRAKDNGIAGASSPASWDLKYSPELDGTPAGDWIERFRDTHPCECCSSHGGHCDITGDRLPGRCNCRMTRVPGEWQ